MARSRSHPVEQRRRAKTFQFLGLAILAIATLVLVYLAMSSNG